MSRKRMFIPDGKEKDLKFYKTRDEEYSLIVRPDGFFVLYKRNHKKDNVYDWVETYFHSFKECEKYIEKTKESKVNGIESVVME